MEEQLITKETAKLAKEKEFKNGGISFYDRDSPELITGIYYVNDDENLNTYEAPTQSLLQRWLREIQGVNVIVLCDYRFQPEPIELVGYSYKINNKDLTINEATEPDVRYDTYEEALEIGLQEALKYYD